MSSYRGPRQLKFPQWSYLQEGTVNQCDTAGVPSPQSAQVMEFPCKDEAYQLMEEILERSNMQKALMRLETNKGSAGTDGIGIEDFRQYLVKNWPTIKGKLLSGIYKPGPVLKVEIPKRAGGKRELGIPTMIDRLINQAILQKLTPIFDPGFSDSSYGFRPGRNAHQAIRQAQKYILEDHRYVVDMDIEKFFDRVNHDILMSRLSRKVKDKRLLALIGRYLRSGIMEKGCCNSREEGTPQGSPLSPLLSNIILDDLDKELEKRGHKFVRYADDCNIYVKSPRAGKRVMASIQRFLERHLKLRCNQAKSSVGAVSRRKFLGFSFFALKEARVRLAPSAKKEFQEKIKRLTKRTLGISMEERIQRINSYINGWIGYYHLAKTPTVYRDFDSWIRRRLRACLLKQWKLPRTKRRKLKGLGVRDSLAKQVSGSSKGCWRLSTVKPVQIALSNSYWKQKGLVSLQERYSKLCQSL